MKLETDPPEEKGGYKSNKLININACPYYTTMLARALGNRESHTVYSCSSESLCRNSYHLF